MGLDAFIQTDYYLNQSPHIGRGKTRLDGVVSAGRMYLFVLISLETKNATNLEHLLYGLGPACIESPKNRVSFQDFSPSSGKGKNDGFVFGLFGLSCLSLG
jgi:hypothetical protein